MRGLVTEAVKLLRTDRRRRIDAVIDYFGDSPDRRRAATYERSPRHVARG
jgi:hypothetical protein